MPSWTKGKEFLLLRIIQRACRVTRSEERVAEWFFLPNYYQVSDGRRFYLAAFFYE